MLFVALQWVKMSSETKERTTERDRGREREGEKNTQHSLARSNKKSYSHIRMAKVKSRIASFECVWGNWMAFYSVDAFIPCCALCVCDVCTTDYAYVVTTGRNKNRQRKIEESEFKLNIVARQTNEYVVYDPLALGFSPSLVPSLRCKCFRVQFNHIMHVQMQYIVLRALCSDP